MLIAAFILCTLKWLTSQKPKPQCPVNDSVTHCQILKAEVWIIKCAHPSTTTPSHLRSSMIPFLLANSPAVTPSPPQTSTTACLTGHHHHVALAYRYKLNLSYDKTRVRFNIHLLVISREGWTIQKSHSLYNGTLYVINKNQNQNWLCWPSMCACTRNLTRVQTNRNALLCFLS